MALTMRDMRFSIYVLILARPDQLTAVGVDRAGIHYDLSSFASYYYYSSLATIMI